MEGRIHSVQTLGTVDGPGVRCVVFLQGCPLRCACCHNPDTWDISDGNITDSASLTERVLRYRNYWGASGGVTVSGGEPLLQAEFCADFFTRLHSAGIHTALDTSGCIMNASVRLLLKYTDLVILDLKYSSEQKYRQYTGGSLLQTESFLELSQNLNKDIWLRRVIIPGLNDTEEETEYLRTVSIRYPNISKVELLPFRKLCIPKYRSMDIPFSLEETPEPTQELMDRLNRIIAT